MQLRMEERISLCEAFSVNYIHFVVATTLQSRLGLYKFFQVKIHSLFNTENSNYSFRLKFRSQLFKMLPDTSTPLLGRKVASH